MRAVLATPFAILALVLLPASPASAAFVGEGKDAAGDAADPHPGRDIVSVGLAYDRRTGRLDGAVRLAGEPSGDAPANLTLFAGRRTSSGCNRYPAVGFATLTDSRNADWVRLDGAGQARNGAASKTYDGASEEYAATSRTLRGVRPDCVIAQLTAPGNLAVVYDTAGPFKMRGLPELTAKLSRVPSVMRAGRTRTLRLTLRNRGDASTGRIRLKAKGARGLRVRLPKTVRTIAAGKRRTVNVRVTLSSRARTSTDLRITATAKDGLRARDERSLYLRKPSAGGGGGGGADGPNLCFRYHWQPPFSQLVPC
ncbi:MAG: NEW3 domain-containing protein [Solirubrobacteraceae bacterium]|nr:NEW3 domain-containing protein [Solirubrobacteraceae bacterium]